MMQPLPAFVLWLCWGSGLLVVLVALPMWMKRVPPNHLYGARFPSTLADPQVWYVINARAGRSLAVIGALYSILIGAVAVVPGWNHAASLLGATALFVVALIATTVRLSVAANRLHAAGKHEQPNEGLPDER